MGKTRLGLAAALVAGAVCGAATASASVGTNQVSAANDADTITVTVSGAGYVQAPFDGGVICASTCEYEISAGTFLFQAIADTQAGGSFEGWGGRCAGQGSEVCTITLSDGDVISANFSESGRRSVFLTVTGPGQIVNNIDERLCDGPCVFDFDRTQTVTLSALDLQSYTDVSWSGPCEGARDFCELDMARTQFVDVTFAQIIHPVDIDISGNGVLFWRANHPDRAAQIGFCRDPGTEDCALEFLQGSSVEFEVRPWFGLESILNTWSGDCEGFSVEETCSVQVDGPRQLGADFKLIFQVIANGTGTVSTIPPLESFPGDPSQGIAYLDSGQQITAIAEGIPGVTTFDQWEMFEDRSPVLAELGCKESETSQCPITMEDKGRFLYARYANFLDVTVVGGGQVEIFFLESDPETCGANTTCNTLIRSRDQRDVDLWPTAEEGWEFSEWFGDCEFVDPIDNICQVDGTRSASATVIFRQPNQLFSATAPGARSSTVGGDPVTAFVSVLASQGRQAENCTISAPDGAPTTLTYQQTDASNAPVGDFNPVFDIDGSNPKTFVMALTPDSETGPEGYTFHPVVQCDAEYAAPIVGVNSVSLVFRGEAGPDIISIGATPSGDGVVRVSENPGVEALTAAAVNIGSGDGSGAVDEATILVTADTGEAELPLSLTVCETDPATGACLAEQASSVETLFTGPDAKFFTAFVYTDGDEGVAFDPANARVFLRFTDANDIVRSVTGAAVIAPAIGGEPVPVSAAGRWAVQVSRPNTHWPPQRSGTLYVAGDGRGALVSDDWVRLIALERNDEGAVAGSFIGEGPHANLSGTLDPQASINLTYRAQGLSGSIWGVFDARSLQAAFDPTGDYASSAGSVTIASSGLMTGVLGQCAVLGQAHPQADAAPGLRAYSVNLQGCEDSGPYLAVVDERPHGPRLLLAGERTSFILPALDGAVASASTHSSP